jgi:hypothetical protein
VQLLKRPVLETAGLAAVTPYGVSLHLLVLRSVNAPLLLPAAVPGNWLNVAMGPLCGTDTGLNGTGACAAAASAAALALAAPSLLLASPASGRGRHSNSPTAPAALPNKLRVTVPGPPVGGGLAGLKGFTAAASAGLRVAW